MKYVTLLWVVLVVSVSFGTNINYDNFTKGNKFYESKDYDSALVHYRAVLNNGIVNSALYYNIGNCYFRKNNIAKAILFYERALRLSPKDEDIKANLKFARLHIIDKIPEEQSNVVTYFLRYLHNLFGLKTELIFLFVVLFLFSAVLSLSLYVSGNRRLWFIYIFVILFAISALLAVSTGFKIYSVETERYAIVMKPIIEAKNAPEGEKTIFTAHAGTKFKILKSEGDWFYVSLPNGVSGWVRNDKIEPI